MSDITRIDTNARMSRAVITNGFVYLSGLTADDTSQDIKGQTAQILQKIEHYLAQAGVDKTRLVSAQIWLKDIEKDFAGMNDVWDAWVPQGHAPARATGESKLASPNLLVEIIAIARAV
ncbi:MAG: RidA family protein [Candidimonas sp.]|jgi:enamine deaminase RidA (YjgF/YER057c/UK114 family)